MKRGGVKSLADPMGFTGAGESVRVGLPTMQWHSGRDTRCNRGRGNTLRNGRVVSRAKSWGTGSLSVSNLSRVSSLPSVIPFQLSNLLTVEFALQPKKAW